MCDCITKVNELLKDKGERLGLNIRLDGSPSTPHISTVKLGYSKPGKVNLIAEFCPFCGKRYEPL